MHNQNDESAVETCNAYSKVDAAGTAEKKVSHPTTKAIALDLPGGGSGILKASGWIGGRQPSMRATEAALASTHRPCECCQGGAVSSGECPAVAAGEVFVRGLTHALPQLATFAPLRWWPIRHKAAIWSTPGWGRRWEFANVLPGQR